MDPEATLTWLDKGEPPPRGDRLRVRRRALPANSETRVSYEVLLKPVLARNAALAKIGIVHFLEVRGAPVAEAAGASRCRARSAA